jgi:PAS domain S-box-containing protein
MDDISGSDISMAEEKELRLNEQQFRMLVQGVTDYAIFLIDPQGRVSSWNAGAQRIKGYLPREIIGEHFSRFYTEEDRQTDEPRKALDVATRDGRFEKEGWRVRKNGTRFMAHVVIDAIRDDDGKVIGFAKITRDITERKIAERTLEKARETFFQSQKMDAIGQLTGGMAHDFNNLLMAILGSIELVRKRLPEDPRITPLLDNAIQGARRGTALTQRMLAFARKQDLKTEAMDIPSLVHGMKELLQRSLGPHVTIEARFPLAIAPARGDTNQLELALLNLVMNARDAMPEGGHIVIAAREEDAVSDNTNGLSDGRYVCVSVTDTGEGMDEETLAHATEPFFTTKGIGKGTGLGLAMVHGMAQQLHGRLVLNSRKGEGTTAEIWLPAATEKPVAAVRQVADDVTKQPRSLKILAVDDDALVLMNTSAMLEELGHTVFEAYSGKAALEVLHKTPSIDLIITDQAMPQMTGVQLAQAVKAEFCDLPIILATGYAELPPSPDLHLQKLAKPFSEHDLARAIAETFGSISMMRA